ncbi:MAG: hypothetical protein K2X82_01405 [Gemmataceae bacterium]|nr:hypothetical protein [Gemmataceae bacterium]
MRRIVLAAVLAAGVVPAAGCGDGDGKNSDPKPAAGNAPDPRLKPGAVGGAGKTGERVAPKGN